MPKEPKLEVQEPYVPFPSFQGWVVGLVPDVERWDRHLERLAEYRSANAEELARANAIVGRMAAVETGAIEELYKVEAGFTRTIATQASAWQQALDSKGPDARALIKSQLKVYELVRGTSGASTRMSSSPPTPPSCTSAGSPKPAGVRRKR